MSSDLHRVMELVREVCDRWDDPAAWRSHLLRGACDLLDASVGSIWATNLPNPRRLEECAIVAVEGLPQVLQEQLMRPAMDVHEHKDIATELDSGMPGMAKFFAAFEADGRATAARDELTDPETYHASVAYRRFRGPANCDNYLISIRHVDVPTRAEVLDIDRPHGAAPFSPRDVALLRLLHDEVAMLVGVRLATEDHLSRDGLSRRLRDTLDALLDGLSEKEAAERLGLRQPTVHEYVGVLYEHFRVNSRPALMAYFVKRHPCRR